jgi:hypothetical protein
MLATGRRFCVVRVDLEREAKNYFDLERAVSSSRFDLPRGARPRIRGRAP